MLNPKDKIPIHLMPVVADGYHPAISLHKESGVPVVSADTGELTVDGEAFTYTGKSLSSLAAEIRRSLPDITASSHLEVVPESSSLLLYDDDLTPENGRVVRYMGLSMKVTERTRIRLLKPHPDPHTSAWWPRINRGSFKTKINGVTYTFAVPEYSTQAWSPTFGKPYIDQGGVQVKVLDEKILKLPRTPIVGLTGTINLERNGSYMPISAIEDVDENNGLVYLRSAIDLGDRIFADYTYREDDYIYKGVNLNPTLQHSPYLIERFVLFYLVPYTSGDGLRNTTTIRHVVGTTIEGAISTLKKGVSGEVPISILGAVRTRQVEDASDVSVSDSRREGGGVRPDINAQGIEQESWFYTDIGNYDGRPYPGNSVLVIQLPRSTLEVFSDEQIRSILGRHVALGTVTLVDFEE